MFMRAFRPLRAPSASLVQTPIRFILPVRTRTFATSTIETHAPQSSPEFSPLPESSPLSSSPETATATIPPTHEAPEVPEAPAPVEAAVPTEAATPTPTTPTPARPTPARPTKESTPKRESASTEGPAQPPPQLPYFVGRNPFNNLAVYQRRKRGGNMKVTMVKKGEGNLQALKHDIKKFLKLNDDEVAVNSVTRHIVLKGFRKAEVIHFLRTLGF